MPNKSLTTFLSEWGGQVNAMIENSSASDTSTVDGGTGSIEIVEKRVPTLEVSYYWRYDVSRNYAMYWVYVYDGDGELYAWGDDGSYSGGGMYSLEEAQDNGVPLEIDTVNKRIYFEQPNASTSWGIYIYATEGKNYAAKEEYFEDSEI